MEFKLRELNLDYYKAGYLHRQKQTHEKVNCGKLNKSGKKVLIKAITSSEQDTYMDKNTNQINHTREKLNGRVFRVLTLFIKERGFFVILHLIKLNLG